MHRDARLTPTGRRIMSNRSRRERRKLTSRSRRRCRGRRCRSGGGTGSPKAARGCGTGPRNRIDHRHRTSKRVEAGVSAASVEASGATDGRDAHRRARVDGAQEPGPPRPRPARPDRPPDRTRRPPHGRAHPGEPIHPDVGKVAGIPPGGGWRVRGRGRVENGRVGCTDLPCAVDDRSRVACVEAHDDERAETPVGFRSRARDWFRARAMTVDDATSDNGSNFRAGLFAAVSAGRATRHRRTGPYRPRSNGKVERFNPTTADGLLHSFTFRSDNERRRRPDRRVHDHNHHRNHTAVGGPPASRVHNVCGSYN